MKIFNTMTRQKEELVPLQPGRIKMYACGPTVYDFFHIGNARAFITFDMLRRYLEYRGYVVEFCQNFTDIDDKMIARANAENITVAELADRFIAEYYKDADKLHILRPTHQPRATDTMEEIIALISTLEEKGFAYELEDGVYFDVLKYPEYGCLSHMRLNELKEGASDRDVQTVGKKSPMDFALWKKKKEDEPYWASPWGEGRPGWHIECSAMIKKYLGTTIDIHGGGQDLTFPHHENELAQSTAGNGEPFVKYWMHNGFINVNNEKMGKSLGNFFTVRDITEKYSHDIIRFFIISSHYRMPVNFSADLLQASENGLERIRNSVENLRFTAKKQEADATIAAEQEKTLSTAILQAKEAFVSAMEDDLNTADAVTAVYELVRAANTAASGAVGKRLLTQAADTIVELMEVLGVPVDKKDEDADVIPPEILALVEKRSDAKASKNFILADAIRDEIVAKGYQIKDTPQGAQVTKL